MDIFRLNNVLKTSSFILLLVFAFSFSHSELDQFLFDEEIPHSEHDFCNLVDDLTLQISKHSQLNLKEVVDVLPLNIFHSLYFEAEENPLALQHTVQLSDNIPTNAIFIRISALLI